MSADTCTTTCCKASYGTHADLVKAVNAWCFERGLYVVQIVSWSTPLPFGLLEVRIQPGYGRRVWRVTDERIAGIIDKLNELFARCEP